eukprot:5702605-Alexandrium_andersonii.AAC.1
MAAHRRSDRGSDLQLSCCGALISKLRYSPRVRPRPLSQIFSRRASSLREAGRMRISPQAGPES